MPRATPTGSVPSLSTGDNSLRCAWRAELPLTSSTHSPVDLCVIGIVDEVVAGGKVVFHK